MYTYVTYHEIIYIHIHIYIYIYNSYIDIYVIGARSLFIIFYIQIYTHHISLASPGGRSHRSQGEQLRAGRTSAPRWRLPRAREIPGDPVKAHLRSFLGGIFLEMPSGKHTKTYGKSPFSMEKSTISMVMFNSYVKLPEGKHPQKWGFLNHSGVFHERNYISS